MSATKTEIVENPRRVSVKWVGDLKTEVNIRDLHHLKGDEPEVYGGEDTGPMPTDLFLASVASCMALTVSSVARKKRLSLEQLEVNIRGENHPDDDRIGKLYMHISADLPSDKLEKLVAQSEKICYISKSLAGSIEISSTHESLVD